jgi:hypothetical protein
MCFPLILITETKIERMKAKKKRKEKKTPGGGRTRSLAMTYDGFIAGIFVSIKYIVVVGVTGLLTSRMRYPIAPQGPIVAIRLTKKTYGVDDPTVYFESDSIQILIFV